MDARRSLASDATCLLVAAHTRSLPVIPMYSSETVDATVDLAASFRRVALRHRWILGPEVDGFEEAFARYCGVRHAVGVGNGTDALELALRAVGVGPGDGVVLVANAGFYGSTAARLIGAEVRYVDIDPDTYLMDPASLARELASRPGSRAVVVTHLYGRLAPMPALLAAADAAGVPVVEDCAQAHGAIRDGRRAGAYGAASTFSFYPTKNLGGTGDGGAVLTDDPSIAERVRLLRQYGWTEKYRVGAGPGARNSRLDELQAAVLLDRLPFLDGWNAERRAIGERYRAGLAGASGIDLPSPYGEDAVAHQVVVGVPRRDRIRELLRDEGIATEVHYPIADHLQPVWGDASTPGSLPTTERACSRVLSLPCYPGLVPGDVDRVVAGLRRALDVVTPGGA